MNVPLVLLAVVGLAWSIEPSPVSDASSKEEFTIYLTPWASKVIQVKDFEDESRIPNVDADKGNPSPTGVKPVTTTTNVPATESSFGIDLSQRLFFANYQDSQFRWKTLDLSGLDLNSENIKTILHSLNETTLKSIARLDLSHNRVSGLPERIWPLQLEYSLRELRLDHNQLYIDDPMIRRATRFELLRLINLKKLSISHCELTSHVSLLILDYPQWIESLDLSGNRLVDLPFSLASLTALRNLDLSGNNLRYLSAGPLNTLTNLQTLNLSHNGLERMWDDPFEKLHSLESLHLDHNSLTEPPKLYVFTGSYQPRMEVYLSGNSFKCGCAFQNFVDIGRLQVMDKLNVTCFDSDGMEWSLDAAPRDQCSQPWVSVREKWTGAKEWFRDNRPDWSTLYRSLGWVLFGVTLGLVYAHRRSKKTSSPSQVPYNILDDRVGC